MSKLPEKSLRTRALDALARREHSRHELSHKLAPYAASSCQLNDLLEDLQSHGWLSDARFATQRVNARQNRYGSRKIASELREKGVDEGLITAALENLQSSELERVRSVWQKKFGQAATSEQEKAKQIRFLQSRGFGWDVIRQIFKFPDD